MPLLSLLLLQAAAAAPTPLPPRWLNTGAISFQDYPDEALRKGEAGLVSVLVHVTEQGRARQCSVTETSGSRSLDTSTCALLVRRGRFEPAKAADGRPVEGGFRTVLSWGVDGRMPTAKFDLTMQVSRLPSAYAGPLTAQVHFDGQGRAAVCEPTKSTGDAGLDATICGRLLKQLTVKPPVSASSEPARAVRFVQVALSSQAAPEAQK